jgi:hypothetical protein
MSSTNVETDNLNIFTTLGVEHINSNINHDSVIDTSPIDVASHTPTKCKCVTLGSPCGENWTCFNFHAQIQCPHDCNIPNCKNQVF